MKLFLVGLFSAAKVFAAGFATANLTYPHHSLAYPPHKDSSAFQVLRVSVAVFVLAQDAEDWTERERQCIHTDLHDVVLFSLCLCTCALTHKSPRACR